MARDGQEQGAPKAHRKQPKPIQSLKAMFTLTLIPLQWVSALSGACSAWMLRLKHGVVLIIAGPLGSIDFTPAAPVSSCERL